MFLSHYKTETYSKRNAEEVAGQKDSSRTTAK